MPEQAKPVVLITGASSVIGAATAAVLAATHHVAITARREGKLAEVAQQTGALPIVADTDRPEDCERAVGETVKAFGRLDGLVLNAGIVRAAPLADLPLADWEAVVRTNLTSAFLMAKCAMLHLLKSRGAIVAVSSLAALRASPSFAAYSAAKAGMVMMTQTIARDYGPQGVRANVVCPGWIRTEMSVQEMADYAAATGSDTETAFRKAVEHVPARRVAEAREVAEPIAFLLSPKASYINGAVLSVDGGAAIVDAGTLMFG